MASAALLRPAHARLLARRMPGGVPPPMLARALSSYLVTPSELLQALDRNPSPTVPNAPPRIVPLCASWFMPNDPHGRTGIQSFREKRIPKARFLDLDAVIDRRSPYPHMLPAPKDFAAAMSELGIRRDDTVVVYDTHELGVFSAPRVGWTLRVFGHPRVHLLNNFRVWVDHGLPVETGEFYSIECCQYPIPKFDDARVASFEDVRNVVAPASQQQAPGESVQVLDARSRGRWSGKDPEPRQGLSSGHMPGSISMPFTDVLDPATKTFLPEEKLREVFDSNGVDPAKPVIATCGTGVTACVIETALEVAGYGTPGGVRVYDGSWTEWAQRVTPSESLIVKSHQP